mmetsp:Transcript_1786/g.5834  ORF Transcript_1786/g.5834 Transcript_1786/m.5834 type:complete len:211 (-) Transcript_1786:1048-1680(-)
MMLPSGQTQPSALLPRRAPIQQPAPVAASQRATPCSDSTPAGEKRRALHFSRQWAEASAALRRPTAALRRELRAPPPKRRKHSPSSNDCEKPWGQASPPPVPAFTTHGGTPPVSGHAPSAASNSGQPGQQAAAPPGRPLQPLPPHPPHAASQQKRPSSLRTPSHIGLLRLPSPAPLPPPVRRSETASATGPDVKPAATTEAAADEAARRR